MAQSASPPPPGPSPSVQGNEPIPQDKLLALACDNALKGRATPVYDHDKVKEWSAQIITSLLASLRETHPQVKWLVTATLMQSSPTVNAGTSTNSSNGAPAVQQSNTRGVFIAQAAWWDNAQDGMKNFDLWNEKGYGGVDVTVCIAWITA